MSGRLVEALGDARRVFVDSNTLIYFIEEEQPRLLDLLDPFFRAVDAGAVTMLASTVSLLEVLVKPLRLGRSDLVREYREILLRSEHVELFPVDAAVAERAARLRADALAASRALSPPDALLLATAAVHGADVFVTNDGRLPSVRPLPVVALNELVL